MLLQPRRQPSSRWPHLLDPPTPQAGKLLAVEVHGDDLRVVEDRNDRRAPRVVTGGVQLHLLQGAHRGYGDVPDRPGVRLDIVHAPLGATVAQSPNFTVHLYSIFYRPGLLR